MRPGQHNKRPRGGGGGGGRPNNNNNNNRKQGHGPNRNYDSNGPDVKIRGTAPHIFEKYQQLARDAHSAGDRVAAENYLQHAEHYYRLMVANNLVPQRNPAQPPEATGTGPQPDMSGLELMLNGEAEGSSEGEPPEFDLDGEQRIAG